MDALPQTALNTAPVKQVGAFVAWGLSWRVAVSGISEGWLAGTIVSTIALGIVTLLGLLFVYATIRFLHQCDDFQRKTHVNALSLSAGTGFLAAAILVLAQQTGLAVFAGIGFDSLATIMFATYLISAFVGYWRAK